MAGSLIPGAGAYRLSGPHDHRDRSCRYQTAARADLMLDVFREVVVADFEFIATPGNRPVPVCLVARELRSGRRFRIWQDQFGPTPPYATGPDVLFVAYYASAELGCYRVLGWPMPERILACSSNFERAPTGSTRRLGAA